MGSGRAGCLWEIAGLTAGTEKCIHSYTEPQTRRPPVLALSRRESEQIRLGDSIVVTVVQVAGDKVRLGIEAPSDVLVLRDELEPRDHARANVLVDCDQSRGRTAPVRPL